LAALSGPLHDVAVVLLDTGLRIKECLSLEWSNVHLEPANGATHGYLTMRAGRSKNSKPRNVPLTARVVTVLKTGDRRKVLFFTARVDNRFIRRGSMSNLLTPENGSNCLMNLYRIPSGTPTEPVWANLEPMRSL
jgi:integrase